jgi:uncharacterized membrane protein YkvA (DUF1232 family)
MKLHPSVWLAAAFLYVICPLDFDFVPAIGWVDDVFVAMTSIRKFSAGMQSRRAAGSGTIDVSPRAYVTKQAAGRKPHNSN